ncbi:MAG: fumarate hydratase C-terminal domain-containing protein, partial [Candidatus Adiutricales bacterium]
MTGTHRLRAPLGRDALEPLRAGNTVLISGTMYTARDAAHQRLITAIEQDEDLPFDVSGQILYYVGPTPAPPGRVIGAAG